MPVPTPENIADQHFLDNTPLRSHRAEKRYPKAVPHTAPLREPDLEWVESSLAAMTIEQKVGQLIICSTSSTNLTTALQQIRDYHLGGFVFLGNGQSAANVVSSVNTLQAESPFPLWFAIDSEAGLGARVADATIFPLLMAFGAAGDPNLAELCGRITARESRALGLQITFGPVVDLNTEPLSPIISTRSYSDRPDLVSFVARGYLRGARAEGILGTLKHYPGHGAADGDSHSSLPTIDIPLSQIEDIHLRPYLQLAGTHDVDLVMTAHVWFPATDPGTPWPATLSPRFNRQILREEIGFEGILISDAYDMVGLTLAVPDVRERAVLGIEAGLDIVLGPNNAEVGETWQGIVDAVKSGRITEDRLDESVRRVLTAKSRSGLPENRLADPTLWESVLDHPEHRAVVRQVCEKACTRVFDRSGRTATIAADERVLVLILTPSQRIFYRFGTETFQARFTELHPGATYRTVARTLDTTAVASLIADAENHDRVVVVGTDWTRITSTSQINLINQLAAEGHAPIYAGFGAPYHIQAIGGVESFYCGYSTVPEMQEVMAEVLVGARVPEGRLPVSFDEIAPPPVPSGLITR